MNKFYLEMFVTVVETRRLTTAAKVLNITQPAISHQVRHLEGYFGVKLLTRGPHGVLPSPAGETLYRHAKQILGQFDLLEREIDDLTRAEEREIIIGATPTAGNYLLPCNLWTFKDKFPKANLRLEVGNCGDMAGRVLTREVDLAVVEGPVPAKFTTAPGIRCRLMSSDQLVLATPVRSGSTGERLTIKTLCAAPLVLPSKGTGLQEQFEAALQELGIAMRDLTIKTQLGGLDGMKSAVETHGGVLVCTRMAVQKELRRGLYRDVTPDEFRVDVPFTVMYREEGLPPVARRFVRFIAGPDELAPCWA